MKEWEKNHRYVQRLRVLNRNPNANYETFRRGIENKNPEICANVLIGLIKVTTYILNHQLKHLEKEFLREGGLRERMSKARIILRNRRLK
jgi:four helix bundle suffix protein